MNNTYDKVEFTPSERRWWAFKFIVRSPFFSLYAFWVDLDDEEIKLEEWSF